jgi:hypothetical protein
MGKILNLFGGLLCNIKVLSVLGGGGKSDYEINGCYGINNKSIYRYLKNTSYYVSSHQIKI